MLCIYKVGAGSDGLCVMLKERLKESEIMKRHKKYLRSYLLHKQKIEI